MPFARKNINKPEHRNNTKRLNKDEKCVHLGYMKTWNCGQLLATAHQSTEIEIEDETNHKIQPLFINEMRKRAKCVAENNPDYWGCGAALWQEPNAFMSTSHTLKRWTD